MYPNEPQRYRAFESLFRDDPAPQPPEKRVQHRTVYPGNRVLAAFVLLAAIAALFLLL